MEEKVRTVVVEVTRGAKRAFVRRVKEAQRLAVKAFRRSSDYQRDLNEATTDSFLMGFEDCRTKVLQKYPDVDLGSMSSIDTPSMPQVPDSPPVGDAEAPIAPTEEGDVVKD